MASSLRIPERYLPGMRVIADLSRKDVDHVCEVLTDVPERLSTPRLVDLITSAVPRLSDLAEDLLEAISSVGALITDDPLTPDDEIGVIAAEIGASPDLGLSGEELSEFVQRLSALLRLQALGLAARARNIVSEDERVFHGARILTDLRPVFAAKASDGPMAATVVATLRMDYHRAGERSVSSAYFSLDRSDLTLLRQHIDRALEKTEALRLLAARAELPYWEHDDS